MIIRTKQNNWGLCPITIIHHIKQWAELYIIVIYHRIRPYSSSSQSEYIISPSPSPGPSVRDCIGESVQRDSQAEPWETGRASMSSSLIQIMNPKQHSSWLQTLTLSHGKWKQNRNKIKQGDRDRKILLTQIHKEEKVSPHQLLECLTF